MKASSIPTKFPVPWGNSAGGAYIRPIPTPSQIGIQAGAASLTDGFPPDCLTAVAQGGVPPFGQDMNGILNEITLWTQWQQAGGTVPYDSTFATEIGGYPQGAVVASATTAGVFWMSTVDNNLNNPDANGAGWVIAGSPRIGVVTMRYAGTSGSGAWIVFLPNGSILNTSASTTSGLQEAINYAIQHGHRLEVYGRGAEIVSTQNGVLGGTNIITGLNTSTLSQNLFVTGPGVPANTIITSVDSPSQIHISNAATLGGLKTLTFAQNIDTLACTTGINIGPAEQWSCAMYNVNITFSSAVSGVGVFFDSLLICDFSMSGSQIVYQGNAFAVTFAPTNPVPIDGITTISASRIFISNIATPTAIGSASGVVSINCSNGGINNNLFSFIELNGAGAPGSTASAGVGIEILGPTAVTGCEQNIFDIIQIHQVTSAGVQIGVNTTSANVLRQNTWRIGGIEPTGNASIGFDTYGSNDLIWIGAITSEEGSFGTGVVLQTSAGGNQIFLGQAIGEGGTALFESVPGTNYCYGSLRAQASRGSTKGFEIAPDGLITQYINNAAGGTGGVITAFAIQFPNALLSCVASPQNITVGFQASATVSGVTITTASTAGSFSVIAIGY